jgi:hypothetical protein
MQKSAGRSTFRERRFPYAKYAKALDDHIPGSCCDFREWGEWLGWSTEGKHMKPTTDINGPVESKDMVPLPQIHSLPSPG